MKTSFDGVALGIGNAKSYDQWNYTVTDGTEVLLALSENKALIIADKDNFFMATVSIANGADVVSVSKKLGHAAPSITLNIYSHANQEAQLRANKTLEMALYKNA